MNQIISSKGKDPSAIIDDYVKQLESYIAVTTFQLKRISETHNKLGASWKGDQYNQFTTILQNSITDAAKELKKLVEVSQKLKKSSSILKKANNR